VPATRARTVEHVLTKTTPSNADVGVTTEVQYVNTVRRLSYT